MTTTTTKKEDVKEAVTDTTTTTVKKERVKKNPYAAFNIDQSLEEEGRWIDYGDFRVKVARMGGKNTAYSKAMLDISKKYSVSSIKRMNEEKSSKLLNELYINTLIKGWEVWDYDKEEWVAGVHDYSTGEIVEPSFDNIFSVFNNFVELRSDILQKSDNKDNYIKEEVVKN